MKLPFGLLLALQLLLLVTAPAAASSPRPLDDCNATCNVVSPAPQIIGAIPPVVGLTLVVTWFDPVSGTASADCETKCTRCFRSVSIDLGLQGFVWSEGLG
jgi:hypothetical protein